jgi:hypothetical protein
MATKHRARDGKAWKNAKKVCRLTARQLEMARRLGMNPKKLPGLRPSPQQRWKLPVGAFIEECYWKRFGGHPRHHDPRGPEPGSRGPSTPDRDADVSERVRNAEQQAGDLVCYLMNLADDLQKWLAQGTVAPEVLPQVSDELREIVRALDIGEPISAIPALPLPPGPSRPAFSRRGDLEPTFDDDEISGRDRQEPSHSEFGRDTLLTPRAVRDRQVRDQLPQVG